MKTNELQSIEIVANAFCCDFSATANHLNSHFHFRNNFLSGVLMLVVLYIVMGSVLFISLEGEPDDINLIESAEVKPYPNSNDVIYAELRSRWARRRRWMKCKFNKVALNI